MGVWMHIIITLWLFIRHLVLLFATSHKVIYVPYPRLPNGRKIPAGKRLMTFAPTIAIVLRVCDFECCLAVSRIHLSRLKCVHVLSRKNWSSIWSFLASRRGYCLQHPVLESFWPHSDEYHMNVMRQIFHYNIPSRALPTRQLIAMAQQVLDLST